MDDATGTQLSDGAVKVYHEFARLQLFTQWWHWLLLLAACLAVAAYIVFWYRRDGVELPKGMRWGLVLLRVAAFGAILFYFLDLEKRSERMLQKPSRAVVLIDTSLSMGIEDGGQTDSADKRRRIDPVLDVLREGTLVERLRRDHDVVVYRFDEEQNPQLVASFAKTVEQRATTKLPAELAEQRAREVETARRWAMVGQVFVAVAALALIASLILSWRARSSESWGLVVAVVSLLVGCVLLAVANLRYPHIPFATTLGWSTQRVLEAGNLERVVAEKPQDEESQEDEQVVPQWDEELKPKGTETHLGDALQAVINGERGGPIAGIVVFTDGGSNAGRDCADAARSAAGANIPIYCVGVGSGRRPVNVRIADLESPPRVYPGDRFPVRGYLQSFGLEGRTVRVQLTSQPASVDGNTPAEQPEDEYRVTLGQDGELVPVKFEVTPRQLGRRVYHVRITPPAEDGDPRDDERSATVEIVERKNRVLLIAGGPTREFRFLRNLLYRDSDTTLDVYLQTGRPGVSQEADQLLFEFPSTGAELFEYDAIVAFDPDWLALSVDEVELLERWVAEQAGGLIVVAGPVQTPRWAGRRVSDERIKTLRGLYPVVLYSRSAATLSLGRFGSETAWQLQFTRDGKDAEFLQLEDDSLLSEQAWESFDGVYGYFAVKDPKPGAWVYARFSDPSTAIDGELPIYLASHFYGAGRVFFQASGEMWRLRAVDEAYFERYYTKLIRWVSQGRLLRDSTRGVLLVDKERCLIGDSIAVRAMLTDAQHLPLSQPQVTATIIDPDGRRSNFVMRRVENAPREGTYLGQFTARNEGDYRIELKPPLAAADELLTKSVRARIPALETERPERNDVLLRQLADATEGAYYVGVPTALEGAQGRIPLVNAIRPNDQVSFLPGTPDREFERQLMIWLMGIICGTLCLEWLIRRLMRLA